MSELLKIDWSTMVQWILIIGMFVGGMRVAVNKLTRSIDHLTVSLAQLDERLRTQESNHARLDERTQNIQQSVNRLEKHVVGSTR